MVPVDWLVEHATYSPNCYICGEISVARDFAFQFSDGDPTQRTVPALCEKPGGWRRVVDLRERFPGTDEAFDQTLVCYWLAWRKSASGCRCYTFLT